jgi:hypothetical protein
MQKRNAMFLAPLVIVGVALLIVWGGAASAAGTSAGGEVHLYEADTSLAGNLGTVILTGAITDSGTDHQGIPQDGTNRLELSKGSFSIYVNDLGNKLASMPFDPTTCSSAGSATALVPIVAGSGSGAYEGISGTFETKGTTAAILPRLPNGECNTSATQYSGILFAHGSGRVAYNG